MNPPRGNVKFHEPPPPGRIREIAPTADYGMIETSVGLETRLSSASVVDAEFWKLEVGDRVWFTGVTSDDGPAAGTVHREGKHYVVD